MMPAAHYPGGHHVDPDLGRHHRPGWPPHTTPDITTHTAAALLHIHPSYLPRWCRTRHITPTRRGLWPAADITAAAHTRQES